MKIKIFTFTSGMTAAGKNLKKLKSVTAELAFVNK